jgi:Kdo2-lipid IVA lauroyltransferase/acyltransferase
MWLYVVIKAGAWVSRIIPLRVRYRISTVMSDFIWLIWTSKRRTCIDNMSVVLGGSPSDPEVRRVAREAFHQFARGIVDFLGFTNIDPDDPLVTDMPIDGWEHIEAGLSRGKGVILASAHLGSIDMGGITLASRSPNFYAVADVFYPPAVDRLIRRTRESKGYRLIPATSARGIIRALHANALVVVLFDRPLERDEGVPVRLFGRDTALPAGVAVVARHSGATVIPGYIFRNPDNTFRGRAFPSVTDELTGDKARDVQVVMQRVADSMEAAIREAPTQWYMFRPMWPEVGRETQTAPELKSAAAWEGPGSG